MDYHIYTMETPDGKITLQHASAVYDDDFQQAIDHFVSQSYRVRIQKGGEMIMRYVNLSRCSPEERALYDKHEEFWKQQNGQKSELSGGMLRRSVEAYARVKGMEYEDAKNHLKSIKRNRQHDQTALMPVKDMEVK